LHFADDSPSDRTQNDYPSPIAISFGQPGSDAPERISHDGAIALSHRELDSPAPDIFILPMADHQPAPEDFVGFAQ
jgi:hypothetical protein